MRCPGPLGSCSPVCLRGLLRCVCGVLGHLAPVLRCVHSMCCVACVASWALGPRSPVCPLGVLCCVCGVLGPLVLVHRCARSVCCFACAVSRASWLLFTSVPGRGVPSLCCPWCTRVCGVLVLVAPVHQCTCCVRCACAIGGWVPLPPPLIFVFCFLKWKAQTRARAYTYTRVHCRHSHGQPVRRCNSVVSSGVCCRCCGGGRAPGVRLARPDVHGYGSGLVWLGVSLLLVLAG